MGGSWGALHYAEKEKEKVTNNQKMKTMHYWQWIYFFGFFHCITLHKMNIYFNYFNIEVETVIKDNIKLHYKAGSF